MLDFKCSDCMCKTVCVRYPPVCLPADERIRALSILNACEYYKSSDEYVRRPVHLGDKVYIVRKNPHKNGEPAIACGPVAVMQLYDDYQIMVKVRGVGSGLIGVTAFKTRAEAEAVRSEMIKREDKSNGD